MDKKRILIFSTAYVPFVGGAEIAVKEITDRLGDNFEFDLITARFEKKLPIFERIGNIDVYRIGFGNKLIDKLLLLFFGALVALKLNKKKKYMCFWGVMVTFSSGAGYIANAIISLFGGKKVPMVLNLQEGDSEIHLKYKWAGLLDLSWRLALGRTDIVMGLSKYLIERARSKGYKGRTILVPNGVDLQVFLKEISEDGLSHIKNKLGKKDGDIIIVTTSRLVYKNAVDDVISAMVALPKNVYFLVIGTGDLEVQLKKQARDLGLEDRVKFIGFIKNTDLPGYLSVSDIFIRPSRSEGFGNSFIEAMVLKIPVIATPVGGIPDFIIDKETGVFCRTNNPQSIVDAVNLLLNNQDLKINIVDKAFNMVKDQYNWSSIAKLVESEVFDKLSK